MIAVDIKKCIGCQLCKGACLFGAVEFIENTPYINEFCVGCGACVRKCPVDALNLQKSTDKHENIESCQDVWVVLEMESDKKQLKKVSLELLSEARRLADLLHQKAGAVFIADEMLESLEKTLSIAGCDYAHVVLGESFEHYDTIDYSKAIVELVTQHNPSILLIPATENGRDLAPRVSCILRTGLTADCTALDIDEKGNLIQIRPTYGGNIMASIISPNHRPQMATIRPNVLEVHEVKLKKNVELYVYRKEMNREQHGYTLTEIKAQENVFRDVTEANVVIVAGYGIGSKENFKKLEKLALKLNAAVGATRKVVDEGWAPFEVQVGQTGKTIAPDLYIAFGVSGALQHTIGMQNARFKVAVNNDPAAPIFKMCDVPVLGSCVEVAEELLKVIS